MTAYYRTFYRTGDTQFKDFIPDPSFAAANFKDFFGREWLPSNPNALSFDAVVRPFYRVSSTAISALGSTDIVQVATLDPKQNVSVDIFAVADGSVVRSTPENEPWLDQSIRFIAFIAGNPDLSNAASPFDNNGSWTMCVVGSSDVKSTTAFMQVASWDGDVFRYYEVSLIQSKDMTSDSLY